MRKKGRSLRLKEIEDTYKPKAVCGSSGFVLLNDILDLITKWHLWDNQEKINTDWW